MTLTSFYNPYYHYSFLNDLPLVLIWKTVCITLKVVPPVVSEAINIASHYLEM